MQVAVWHVMRPCNLSKDWKASENPFTAVSRWGGQGARRCMCSPLGTAIRELT